MNQIAPRMARALDRRGNEVVTLTARATGLTDSVIPNRDCKVLVPAVATNANDWIVLPAPVPGRDIRGYSAVSHELRTIAGSGVKINGQIADGTKEAAIPEATHWIVYCTTVNSWILKTWNAGGTTVAAIVPHT